MIAIRDALQVISNVRGNKDVVITNQGSSRIWPSISDHRLDFNYNPSSMGGAIPLALGIALAKPDTKVIVLSGDGSLLMSLGCLVSVIASKARNLTIILFDNRSYEVTGGQKTAASQIAVNYADLASAIGFPSVARFAAIADWREQAESELAATGPGFIWLSVGPAAKGDFDVAPISMTDQITAFHDALSANP